MKARLIITVVKRYSDDCIAEEDYLASSDKPHTARHKHERSDSSDILRGLLRGHMCSTDSRYMKTQLVEIPDEIAFQFMMDGVHDNDFIAYNPRTKRIAFSADWNEAQDRVNIPLDHDISSNYGYVKVSSGTNAGYMFDFGRPKYNISPREETVYEVQGEQYGEMYKVLSPYIQYWFTQHLEAIGMDLGNTISHITDELLGAKLSDYYPEEEGSVETLTMNFTTASYIFHEYMDDGELYELTKERYSPSCKENLRKLHVAVHRLGTEEHPVPKSGRIYTDVL